MACRCKERREAITRAIANPKTAKREAQFVLRTSMEDAGRSWRKRGKAKTNG